MTMKIRLDPPPEQSSKPLAVVLVALVIVFGAILFFLASCHKEVKAESEGSTKATSTSSQTTATSSSTQTEKNAQGETTKTVTTEKQTGPSSTETTVTEKDYEPEAAPTVENPHPRRVVKHERITDTKTSRGPGERRTTSGESGATTSSEKSAAATGSSTASANAANVDTTTKTKNDTTTKFGLSWKWWLGISAALATGISLLWHFKPPWLTVALAVVTKPFKWLKSIFAKG